MKILTIIVSYNFEPWITRCLGSLRASEYPTDIIVIDNGSGDRTTAIIRTDYPEVRLLANRQNLGFGMANNLGMAIALDEQYDAVFLLNQDAWIDPDTLGTLARQAAAHTDFGILSPTHLNGRGDLLDKGFAAYAGFDEHCRPAGPEHPRACPFINAAFWFIPAGTLRRVGGFSPLFYHYGEDKDYVNRLHYHGLKIGYIPTVYGYHDRETRQSSHRAILRAEGVYLLSEYANINYPWPKAFAFSILAGIKKLFQAFSAADRAFYLAGYARILTDLLRKSSSVCRIRKICRKTNPNFLQS